MRFCSKCKDFYADRLLAFCLIDGTPLVDVDPSGESWNEGVRIIDQKAIVLRKQNRKLKWRRIAFGATTIMITTMVVCVVAVNGLLYVRPGITDANADVKNNNGAANADVRNNNEVADANVRNNNEVPNANVRNNNGGANANVRNNNGGENANVRNNNVPTNANVRNNNAATNTSANANANSGGVVIVANASAGGITVANANANVNTSSDASVNANKKPKDKKGFFKKLFDNVTITTGSTTSTNASTHSDADGNSNSETVCSDEEKNRERQIIIDRFGGIWRRNIEGERARIIAENIPADIKSAEASLGPLEPKIGFHKKCATASVTVKYVWQIHSPRGVVTIPKKQTFDCTKERGAWACR